MSFDAFVGSWPLTDRLFRDFETQPCLMQKISSATTEMSDPHPAQWSVGSLIGTGLLGAGLALGLASITYPTRFLTFRDLTAQHQVDAAHRLLSQHIAAVHRSHPPRRAFWGTRHLSIHHSIHPMTGVRTLTGLVHQSLIGRLSGRFRFQRAAAEFDETFRPLRAQNDRLL